MGLLDGVGNLFSDELPTFLGLLIPFAGILIPGLVIIAISSPSRRRRSSSPALGLALQSAGGMADPPAAMVGAPVAAPERRAMKDPDELAWLCERLRESDIFEGLTDHELRLVAGIGERRAVAAGERLAHAGSRGENIYLILSGEFRLLTNTQGEIPVRMAHAGETVPLAAIIDPPVLVTTIEAIPDCEVFAIPRGRLLELFDVQPMIGLQVYRAAAKAFEHRYRKSLDGLVAALRVALQPSRAEVRTPQPQE